jgi:hypothetical protein
MASDQLVQGEVIDTNGRTSMRIGAGTTHPHRNLPNGKVQQARREGAGVFSRELIGCYHSGKGTSMIYGADPNGKMQTLIPGERTAIEHGGTRDFIRYKSHPQGVQLKLLKVGTRPLTIDPHDLLFARFLATFKGDSTIITFVNANIGRGYEPGELRRNVLEVMEFDEGRENVILALQEIDEDDKAPELRVIRQEMEPGTHLVGGRELLALSPGFDRVTRERTPVTMGSGLEIGAPAGTGPTRHSVTCVAHT